MTDPNDIHLFEEDLLDPLRHCAICRFSFTNWRHCDSEGKFSPEDHQRVEREWRQHRERTQTTQ